MPARAQAPTDAGDLFFQAYAAAQQAEKAEQEGKFKIAMSRLQYASKVLDQVSVKFPSWQPPVVTFRKQLTTEGIARVQGKLAKFGPGKPGDAGDGVEPPLPVDDTKLLFSPPAGSTAAAPEPLPMAPVKGSDASGAIQQITDRMDRLQRDLSKAQEDLTKSEAEKRRLAKELEEAIKAREAADKKTTLLQHRSDRAEAAIADAASKGDKNSDAVKALRAELDKTKLQLRDLKIEGEAASEIRQQDLDRIKAAQNKIATLTEARNAAQKMSTDVPGKIASIQKELDQARKEKEDVLSRLAKTETKLNQVQKQRDDALQQVAKMQEAQRQVDKLVADNTQLMAKLADAEKNIRQFKAEGVEKDKKIAALTQEVQDVKKQLATAQKQSGEYQRQMADMQTQLEAKNKQIAQMKTESAASAAERKKMGEENLLLRGIVLRQQKEQARRDQTKKLVLGELAKLEIKSKSLLDHIEYLGQPVVRLTEKERALFKKPELQISDTEITLGAAKADQPALAGEPTMPGKAQAAAEPKPAEPGPEPVTSQPPLPMPPPPDKETAVAKTEEMVKNDTPPALPSAEKTSKSTADPAPPGPTSGNTPNVPPELLPLARDGKDQFERGNYRESEKIYERMLAKAPNNLYILSNLGVVRFRAGKLKLAEESLRKATQVAPEDAFSHCTLGIVFYSQGKYDDSVTELTNALAIQPKNATAHNYLGITASQKGWGDAAQKELEASTALDPTYADAHFNLAVVFATQQPPNKELARKYYKRAIELGAEPDNALEQLIKEK